MIRRGGGHIAQHRPHALSFARGILRTWHGYKAERVSCFDDEIVTCSNTIRSALTQKRQGRHVAIRFDLYRLNEGQDDNADTHAQGDRHECP